jgi:hypothetical protein
MTTRGSIHSLGAVLGDGILADIDRPLSYQQMADDIAALIRHLSLGKANVMGYSILSDTFTTGAVVRRYRILVYSGVQSAEPLHLAGQPGKILRKGFIK